jgi:hypothetical protein
MVEIQMCEVDALSIPFSLAQQWGLFSIIGFPRIQHTSSLADVTMDTKACTLLKAVK